MPRLQLTDVLWSRLRPVLIACGVYATEDLRTAVEGILYKLRTGTPWRDLPREFGAWNTVFKRFNDWCKKGKFKIVFRKLASDPDHEWTFVDGTIVKAHQHSSGAAKGAKSAIGKCVAGNSTKIHLAVDACGMPIEFELTGGQVHDVKMAPTIVDALPELENFIADKGYDSDELRVQIELAGATSNIPRKKNSKTGNGHMDWCLYKYRHLVENAFARLKHFRSIATRYEKLKRNYEGMVCLGCSLMWLPM
jgi:transposase